MKEFLIYLLEVSVCQAGFYLLYRLFYTNLPYFQVNRFYLIGTTMLSFVIPLLSIGIYYANDDNNVVSPLAAWLDFRAALSSSDLVNNTPVLNAPTFSWNLILSSGLLLIYVVGCLLLTFKLCQGVWKVIHLVRNNNIQDRANCKVVTIDRGPAFFSFSRFIFINRNACQLDDDEVSSVLLHESVHIRQKHSYDLIFMEIASIACWFNPFIYKIRTAIGEVHEYLADREVIHHHYNIDNYSSLILKLSKTKNPMHLVHQFSMISMKKRMGMLYLKKPKKMHALKFLFILPALALLIAIFSCTDKTEPASPKNNATAQTEGRPLIINHISWSGNTLYSSEFLTKKLGIQVGDVYSKQKIEDKLNYKPDGSNLGALYMDKGYMYFTLKPKESFVGSNKVDLNFKIYEGPIVKVDKILVQGNHKTSTSKISKMIELKHGQVFSREKLIQSQKNLAASGLFVPTDIAMNPLPHAEDNQLVDIEFVLQEK